jgi:phospholipid/cholesterol/gamma-HCH transport system substrate-binding protein
MNERRLQFQVGLVVLIAVSLGTVLVFRFGDLHKNLEPRYAVQVHLDTAGGLYPSAPVMMSGLPIGRVQTIQFDDQGGVLVLAEVSQQVKLRADTQPMVTRSLLGETALEFLPGRHGDFLAPGSRLEGQGAADPLAMIQRMELRAANVLDSFAATSQEWQNVGKHVNNLMDTRRGDLDLIVERAAESLHQFTQTMQSTNQLVSEANKIVADPRAQQALQETMISLPALVEETRRTIAATRGAVENVNRNLVNLAQVTEPIGERGGVMIAKLESSLTNLDLLLGELNQFAAIVNKPNGTLQKFASDPSLYDNMDRSAQSVAVLLKNLEPVLRDMREFSDKIARNPELLGVGGAMRPSSGLKDTEVLNNQPPRTARPTSRSQSPQ